MNALKRKGQLSLSDIPGTIQILIAVGAIGAVGILILSNLATTQLGSSGFAETSGNFSNPASSAFNSSVGAIFNASLQYGTVGTVIGVLILLGLIFVALRFSGSRI